MSKTRCDHPHGAAVPDLAPWVCGKCYALLDERPRRFEMASDNRGGERQVIWQAEERIAAGGLTLAGFLDAAAKRITARSDMRRPDALRIVVEFLRDDGAEFGDPAYCWDGGGARDIADEMLHDFEEAPSGNG